MSEVNATFTVDATTITISPNQTDISFTPVTNEIIFYGAGKYSNVVPAAGDEGQLQYNSGGNLAATPLTTYLNGILSLGPVANLSIGGGSSGYVLATDGSGDLSWTDRVAASNAATYATTAGSANTANYATGAGSANTANLATLANSATTALGLNATLANTRISGGLNGYVLSTNGNGALAWTPQSGGSQTLANLTDVNIPAPLDGQLLTYSNATSKWVAQNPNSVSGVTKIVAGSGVVLSPTSGVGTVTITASGGAGNYPTGGNTDKIFWENDQSITANYTISATKNAMSIGPVSIANGAVVTISTGSVWAII
jgi:hypothetical protein